MPKKQISTSQISHLSQLANLQLTPKQTDQLHDSFTSLLGYISEVQKIPLAGVEPTAQVTGKVNEFREDVVTPSLTQAEALSGSSRPTHQGYFVVERVLHHDL